jgi:hypothetical protein
MRRILCAPLISAVAAKRQKRIVMRDCKARIVLTAGSAGLVPAQFRCPNGSQIGHLELPPNV